jgi:hypothetical protein
MEIKAAQAEARRVYVGGGPGVVVSGLVWLAAALVLKQEGVRLGFATLFFGGMLIVPVATMIERGLFRRPAPARENALVAIGFETVFAMIGCLIAAFLLLPHRPELVFPVAAVAIGTRYFTFATLYGNKAFYGLGGLITALGAVGVWGAIDIPGGVAFAVAAVEILFGTALTLAFLRVSSRVL